VAGQGKGTFGPEPGDWRAPLPPAIFLDSSVVIYLEKFAGNIWDGILLPTSVGEQLARQIASLRVLVVLADRADILFAVSDEVVRQVGGSFVAELSDRWRQARHEPGQDPGLPLMTLVGDLPMNDQLVIAQAYRSGCGVILTNDLRWIGPKHRRTIAAIGLEAHTPESLLAALEPWLALWL
jgi:hypothetical protein